MKRLLPFGLRTVLLVSFLSVSSFTQDFKPATAVNAKDFLGKWQGSFLGKVFITASLAGDEHKLKGTISSASVEVNDAGELTKAEASEGSDVITSAQVNGKRLHITAKSTDGSEDTIDAEIVLTGPNDAELRMIIPPDVPTDVPRPKPWKLTRVAQ